MKRSELASFKAIGAPNDLIKLILRHYPDYLPNLILTGSYPNFKMALPKCFEASSKRYNRHRRYVMTGLACGKTSPLAWQFLQTSVDYFILISDSQAVNAMKKLARSRVDGIAIVAGNSGAASLAALLALNYFQKEVMHISAQPPLILFNTEWPTAPTIYQELVGKNHTVILDLQMTWLQKSIAKKLFKHREAKAIPLVYRYNLKQNTDYLDETYKID